MTYYAHSNADRSRHLWQLLSAHLIAVGDGALRRAKEGFSKTRIASIDFECQMAGWLHDLGKYRPEFQDYLTGIPTEKEMRYHKQAGAARAALLGYHSVAFGISGHHGGMPNRSDLKDGILGPSGKAVCDAVWDVAVAENPELIKLEPNPNPETTEIEIDFKSRLILSALVDADWSDTANYHRSIVGLPPEPRPEELTKQELAGFLQSLLQFIQSKAVTCNQEKIKQIRADVLDDCLRAADSATGVFSLSVPTGGGKTLSSFAFALQHAILNDLRRVIYVAPYLSIIEQNSQVLRDALGLDSKDVRFFEHHGLAEPPDPTNEDPDPQAAHRRAENWDAPFVVTTNVQFFESLFSNKPSKVRKLHNIARSVVILDECQSLPPGLLMPTAAMLRQMSEQLDCTFVLCTATQPVLNHENIPPEHRLDAKEIVSPERNLFSRLKRVNLQWPAERDESMSWEDVATNMREHSAALCIVNTRRAARELFQSLQSTGDNSVFHLSTTMCPAHRLITIKQVKRRLESGRRCYLVSTQLIEAGVDIDFPLVLREMAPLESIIQAAGRCNREGRLDAGETIVFRSEAAQAEPRKYFPPDKWYKAGRSTLETNFLAAGNPPSIDRSEDIHEYFSRLYHSGTLDNGNIQQARQNLDFPKVTASYRLIDDDSVPVVIGSWEKHRDRVDHMIRRIEKNPSRINFSRLAPFQVNLRRNEIAGELGKCIDQPFQHLELFVWYGPYDERLGMSSESTEQLMIV
ncbi:MAG: CRISPR-associated helicase Cas3' [Pirellulaceae bacterium]